MKKKVIAMMLGICLVITTGCGRIPLMMAQFLTAGEVQSSPSASGSNTPVNPEKETEDSNEVQTDEQQTIETAQGIVLSSDDTHMVIDTAYNEDEAYPAEEDNVKAMEFDINKAKIDIEEGDLRRGIVVALRYYTEDGVNYATFISSDGDEIEPHPAKETETEQSTEDITAEPSTETTTEIATDIETEEESGIAAE